MAALINKNPRRLRGGLTNYANSSAIRSLGVLLGAEELLQLLLELLVALLHEPDLLSVPLLLLLPSLRLPPLDGLASRLELGNLPLQIRLAPLEMRDPRLRVALTLLPAQRLAHAERHGRFVQRLIGGDGHASLVPHAKQEEAALGAVDCHLADELVEALRVELLAHGADAGLARLPRLQLGVQLLLEVDDVQARRGRRRDVLDPERAVALVRARGQDGVEDVLGLRGARLRALDGSERALLHRSRAHHRALVVRGGNRLGGIVLNERADRGNHGWVPSLPCE
mmetsp:Transcript_3180/g.14223  ORF Transcript_3180/g.14223 Transcript_3180/m.14223 type:complete len:283 (-) Transcript_3180:41-889(-)